MRTDWLKNFSENLLEKSFYIFLTKSLLIRNTLIFSDLPASYFSTSLKRLIMPVSSTNGSTKKPFQRLPTDAIPIHYDIYLRPNLVDLVFKGSLKVELDVKKATDTLICNAAEMTVDEIKINDEPIAESKISEEDETLTMKLSKALEPGTKAILSCKFTGELNDKMRGFYRYLLFKYL